MFLETSLTVRNDTMNVRGGLDCKGPYTIDTTCFPQAVSGFPTQKTVADSEKETVHADKTDAYEIKTVDIK